MRKPKVYWPLWQKIFGRKFGPLDLLIWVLIFTLMFFVQGAFHAFVTGTLFGFTLIELIVRVFDRFDGRAWDTLLRGIVIGIGLFLVTIVVSIFRIRLDYTIFVAVGTVIGGLLSVATEAPWLKWLGNAMRRQPAQPVNAQYPFEYKGEQYTADDVETYEPTQQPHGRGVNIRKLQLEHERRLRERK